MFIVQCIRRNGEVRYTDAEWDYGSGSLNWQRAFSFIPRDVLLKVRVDDFGNVVIQYCWN